MDVGFAVNDVPEPDGLQTYVDPPEADMVEDSPLQIAAGEADAVMVAFELTVTVTVVVPEHPLALVPVTE